jgi:uncharacterized membrane protein YccF (DUF307 family)
MTTNGFPGNAPMAVPTAIVVRERPGCLLQLIWFFFVGWWLGLAAIGFAYLMFLFIFTIPIGVLVLNALPELIELRPAARRVTVYGPVQTQQLNIFVRSLWFLLVGWWLTAIVLFLGYLLCLTLIGIPLGFVLFDAAPALLTLRRAA